MELEQLKEITKQVTGVDLETPTRKREVVEARAIYYHLCKNNTNFSLSTIGKSVGKDHSTVLYALRQVKDWSFNDNRIRKQLVDAESKVVFFKKKVQDTGLSFQKIVERYQDLEEQNKHLIQANKTLMGKIVSLKSALKTCNYK